MAATNPTVITPAAFLKHWQGHRALTRRVIEAFPEPELFRFSIGGMRPFSDLALELISLAAPGLRGLVTGDWTAPPREAADRADLLRRWDDGTAEIDALWPRLPESRFQEKVTAFGQWAAPGWSHLFYWVDNEVHHRGQGYVYLRALEIEPPPFWERG
jgi:uncharacterized damage-inducible protein DinB